MESFGVWPRRPPWGFCTPRWPHPAWDGCCLLLMELAGRTCRYGAARGTQNFPVHEKRLETPSGSALLPEDRALPRAHDAHLLLAVRSSIGPLRLRGLQNSSPQIQSRTAGASSRLCLSRHGVLRWPNLGSAFTHPDNPRHATSPSHPAPAEAALALSPERGDEAGRAPGAPQSLRPEPPPAASIPNPRSAGQQTPRSPAAAGAGTSEGSPAEARSRERVPGSPSV